MELNTLLGGWLRLKQALGERSCKPELGTLRVNWCSLEKQKDRQIVDRVDGADSGLGKIRQEKLKCWKNESRSFFLCWCRSTSARRDKQSVWHLFLKAAEELGLCVWDACCLSLSALVLVSVYSEEMPSPYLKHTSSESLCDTVHWPKLGYPHFGDVLVLIANYHL